jgi:hypothetical protein
MQANMDESSPSANDGFAIEALARDAGAEPGFVRVLYERELARLEANATVRGFLSVLACRNVRMLLREARGDNLTAQASSLPPTRLLS